jgi:hypothetical protein
MNHGFGPLQQICNIGLERNTPTLDKPLDLDGGVCSTYEVRSEPSRPLRRGLNVMDARR